MKIDIQESGAFQWALATLETGESLTSESGALFRSTGNIEVDVTTRARSRGGLMSGLKRLLAAEHFFFSRYTVKGSGRGEVGLAPILPGMVREIALDGATRWLCAGGSYLASSEEIEVDTAFQGFKGLLTSSQLFFLRLSGSGSLLLSGFGRLVEIEVKGELVVDSGHVAAFTDDLQYSVSKAGTSWTHSWLAGEGLVFHFSGRGRVICQSHHTTGFGRLLGRLLPPRRR